MSAEVYRIGETDHGSTTEIVQNFSIQSLLLGALGPYAILPGSASGPIIASTLKTYSEPGWAVSLSSDSQAPVALRIKPSRSSRYQTQGSTVRLLPGQTVQPAGRSPFAGFDYGLPFGWLGGGVVRLLVSGEPGARVESGPVRKEILLHRIALTMGATLNTIPNWPMRLPWTQAHSQVNSSGAATSAAVAQSGSPLLVLTPTRTVFLVGNTKAGVAGSGASLPTGTGRVEVVISASDDFGSAAAVGDELVFPVPDSASGNSVVITSGRVPERVGGDSAILSLKPIDLSLSGFDCLISRYGFLA